MSEDKDLLARIATLAGHINLQKVHTPPRLPTPKSSWSQPASMGTSGPNVYSTTHGALFGRPGGRVGKPRLHGHRHRSLILNNVSSVITSLDTTSKTSPDDMMTGPMIEPSGKQPTQSTTSWVSKRDRHMQLINSSIYDRETNLRSKAIDQTRHEREKLKIRDYVEKFADNTAVQTSGKRSTPASGIYVLSINGLSFQVCNGGSRLVRVQGTNDSAKITPKRAIIGGVIFVRSKNGNLYRSGLARLKRLRATPMRIPEPCKRFTTTGRCTTGPRCPYIHDPEKVAICPTYLQKGECPNESSCDLSHSPCPERVPACLHFLRGRCSKANCRYAHIRVDPTAPICRPFAKLGYCARGASCTERHIFECPDYASTGKCRLKDCRLPHVDRAGQLRQQSGKTANISTGSMPGAGGAERDEESDISSEEEDYAEIDSDDLDSDGIDDDLMLEGEEGSNALSQQENFVRV